MIPLFRPQLLQKGDGTLHIQLSLGEFSAELPVPDKFKDPQALGFREFYNDAIGEMMKGLKGLHKTNQQRIKMELKRKNGYQAKRQDRRADSGSNE